MESYSPNSNAPILRLSSDIWPQLSCYIGPNDAVRLIAVGNRVISSRVRQSAHALKLSWSSCSYIDFDRVFGLAFKFKDLRNFSFIDPTSQIRCWTPISWNLLSSRVTSLSLSFVGAIDFLLQPNLCTSHWPGLLSLDLASQVHRPYFGQRNTNSPPIDLCTLPPSLQHLRIHCNAPIVIDPTHLHSLPPNLETLELDFIPAFVINTPREAFGRVMLPSLPNSIKKILLRDSQWDHWQINAAKWPTSLESFRFTVGCFIAIHGDLMAQMCSRFNLERIGHRLPHLTDLQLQLSMSVADAVRLIPRTVTCLRLTLARGTEEDAKLVLSRFGDSLADQYHNWTELNLGILDGSHPLPRLEKLSLPQLVCPKPIIPPFVTRLQVPDTFEGEIPLGITQYFVSRTEETPSQPAFNITPQHKLTNLMLSYTFQASWLERLPSTLETLAVRMKAEDWPETLRVMSETNRLPNLNRINLMKTLFPLEIAISAPIPPQLRRLSISVSSPHWGEPLKPVLLSNLRSSKHLEYFSLTIEGEHAKNPVGFFELLNNLPTHLKQFRLRSNYLPSAKWPVVFPSTIRHLGLAVREPAIQAESESSSIALTLPRSLTRFFCPKILSPSSIDLPPTISILSFGDTGFKSEYFASRVPPSPNSLLDLPSLEADYGDGE